MILIERLDQIGTVVHFWEMPMPQQGVTHLSLLRPVTQMNGTIAAAKVQADDTYMSVVVPTAVAYEKEQCRLLGRFYDAVGQANLGYGIDATFYAPGTSSIDVQV